MPKKRQNTGHYNYNVVTELSKEINKLSMVLNKRQQRLEKQGIEGLSSEMEQILIINREFGKQGVKSVAKELIAGIDDEAQQAKVLAAYIHKLRAAKADSLSTIKGAKQYLKLQGELGNTREQTLIERREKTYGKAIDFKYFDVFGELSTYNSAEISDIVRDYVANPDKEYENL